jgi:hypothetical protein
VFIYNTQISDNLKTFFSGFLKKFSIKSISYIKHAGTRKRPKSGEITRLLEIKRRSESHFFTPLLEVIEQIEILRLGIGLLRCLERNHL